MFPSPFGVMSFLIEKGADSVISKLEMSVSVSFRSCVFSYRYTITEDIKDNIDTFPSPFGVVSFLIHVFDVSQTKGKELPVSVSFRSYVISYDKFVKTNSR